MHSWLQEVRHLTNDVPHEIKKEAVANSYIEDFIDSIPNIMNVIKSSFEAPLLIH